MVHVLTFFLIAPFFILVLATDPRLLDRSADRTLLRRAGDSDLDVMECGHLPPNPSHTAIPLQPGMQLMECRPLQHDSLDAAASKTSGDDFQPDPDAPSLRTSSTFSKTDNNRTDSDDLLSLRFPSEPALSYYSKLNDDEPVPSPDQRNPIPPKYDDDDLQDRYQHESSLHSYDDDDLQPDPDALSLNSSSNHSNPVEDDLLDSSQPQHQQQYYSTIGDSSTQGFGSEIELTSSQRLGHSTIGSPAPRRFGSGTTQLTAPQQECMQCAQECAGPGASPQQAVAETCPHGPGTGQNDFCSGRRLFCTISAVTCCAFLTTFLSVYEQT